MGSGGHRGNAGRPLDPNSLAASKRSGVDVFLRLEDPTSEPPECPLPAVTERELFWWDRLWRRPQASQWAPLRLEDEVALYVRYLVEAEQPGAQSNTRTLVKQYQELLGLSTAGMKRLMWTMPDEGAETAKPQTAPKRKSSSRARLKVVGNDG